MKVVIIGGGPAGLYCGLLMKKASPAHDITIVERNPPDATYGWGVVFSERTLGAFQDADAKTAQAITDRFVIWDAIDVYYRGEVIRCGGQVFAGLSRKRLLNILQRRCEELGVTLRFRTEASDLSAFAGADVIIAADGVNSIVRKTYPRVFKPGLEEGRAKYIWYGTDRWLEAFTFIFRETAHGLFQVHAYPFDGTTSTFIIECAEETWLQADLDRASEDESIAYCERLFAGELAGRRLMSNNSRWINFVTVKNARWHHRNIVLLGDAAHSAHFSIGSGTKLAMEDAIALAQAFERHRDIEGAFNEYEAGRRPAVEAFQQAAAESRTYFENLRRYLHLEPRQFTFNLLTRSGRISYDSLRVRDPYFVDAVDRWFVGTAPGRREGNPPPLVAAPPPILTPLRLRGVMLANRAVLSSRPTDASTNGQPAGPQRDQIVARALGGAGLVMTEPVAVSAAGRMTPGCPGMYHEAHAAAWKALVDFVHANTLAKIALQLNHAGRRGSTRPRQEGLDRPLREDHWPLLSASPVPYAPQGQIPREMVRADMEQVRDEFVRAARLAAEAGFDMLHVHCAHGYLLASFISPLTNQRRDEYGGPLTNRLRFPLEVLDAVRAVWPEDRPIAASLAADDCVQGGLDIDEAVAAATMLHAHGADIIHVLAGQTTPASHPAYGRGFLTTLSDHLRNEARIPTMVSGFLRTADEVNSILAAGRGDLCIMDPPHLDRTPRPNREEEAR